MMLINSCQSIFPAPLSVATPIEGYRKTMEIEREEKGSKGHGPGPTFMSNRASHL